MPLHSPDPIRLAVLKRLAVRYNQMVSNAAASKESQLTPGEISAIVPNAALMDRINLADLNPKPGQRTVDPVGATDLTNQLNESPQRVVLHPVISLWSDLAYALEQKGAPADLCAKVRKNVGSLEKSYSEKLLALGLPKSWPDSRFVFEKALAARGYLDWAAYSAARPRAGCSPEYILDLIAKQQGMVPDPATLDRFLIRGELIGQGFRDEKLDQQVEIAYMRNRIEADQRLHRWREFTAVAEEEYTTKVDGPQMEYAKAWHYACKALPSDQVEDLLKTQSEISAFAGTLDTVNKLVINQAADTATAAVAGPCMEEQIINRGLSLSEKASASILTKIGKKIAEAGIEKGAELAGAAAVTITTAGHGLIWYLAARAAIAITKPLVSKGADELAEGGAGKVASWAKQKAAMMVYEESRAAQTEKSARELVGRRENESLPVEELLLHLTPAGRRSANNVLNAYEASLDPENFEKMLEFIGRPQEDWHIQLAGMCNPEIPATGWSDVVGLKLPSAGTLDETVQIGRMVTASLVESNTNVTQTVGKPEWAHGNNRLTHRLEQSQREIEDHANLDEPRGDHESDQIQFFEDSLDEECMKLLASTCQRHLYPLGEGYQFSGWALSRLLQTATQETERQSKMRSLRPADGYDWSILMAVNTGLWSESLEPGRLRELLASKSMATGMTFDVPTPESREVALARAQKMQEHSRTPLPSQ